MYHYFSTKLKKISGWLAQNFNSESFFCSSILIFNSFNCFFILSNWAGAGGCLSHSSNNIGTVTKTEDIITF
ncbi:hypothetical protein [Spiroplasma endosymbiont of Amphimallon solstitiale]|uniref:hypothetical protein n=1 Tax=Spiroplasma endosymbiont of Amphimallon solstitiale TaxID=3066288 RepID=UPI00313CBE4B